MKNRSSHNNPTNPDSAPAAFATVDRFTKKLVAGGSTLFLGLIVGRIVIFLLEITLGRVLGPVNYGLYALGIALISFIRPFSLLGLDMAIIKFVPVHNVKKEYNKLKGIISGTVIITTVTSVIIAGVLILYSNVIAQKVFDKPSLAQLLRIFAVSLPFYGFMTIGACTLRAFQKYKYDSIIRNVVLPCSNLLLVGALLLFGLSVVGATYSFVISFVLTSIVACFLVCRVFPQLLDDLRARFDYVKTLRYSLPVLMSGMSIFLLANVDKIMLGYFVSDEQLGIYVAATKAPRLLAMFIVSLELACAPIISQLYGSENIQSLQAVFRTVTRWGFLLTLPAAIAMAFFSKDIILLLFGSRFVGGWAIMAILTLPFLLDAMIGPARIILQICDKERWDLVYNFTMVFLDVVLNIILIKKFGIAGAAIATLLAVLFVNLARILGVRFLLHMNPYTISFLKPIAAGLIAVSFCIVFDYFCGGYRYFWILNIIGFMFVYILMLLIFRLEAEDKAILIAVKRKIFK